MKSHYLLIINLKKYMSDENIIPEDQPIEVEQPIETPAEVEAGQPAEFEVEAVDETPEEVPVEAVDETPEEVPVEVAVDEEEEEEDEGPRPEFEHTRVRKIMKDGKSTETHFHCKMENNTTMLVPKELFN